MISIVIAIQSLWACKILNEDKSIEVRKGLALFNALKKAEEMGEEVEFLMCVTKAKPYLSEVYDYSYEISCNETKFAIAGPNVSESELEGEYGILNGKVVARFKAKAELIYRFTRFRIGDGFNTDSMTTRELLDASCLTYKQLFDYLYPKSGTALHICDLEIFDKPKTLADYGLKRAPQSWCYAKEA